MCCAVTCHAVPHVLCCAVSCCAVLCCAAWCRVMSTEHCCAPGLGEVWWCCCCEALRGPAAGRGGTGEGAWGGGGRRGAVWGWGWGWREGVLGAGRGVVVLWNAQGGEGAKGQAGDGVGQCRHNTRGGGRGKSKEGRVRRQGNRGEGEGWMQCF